MKEYFNKWKPPDHWQKIRTVEMHTGGEPLRIILGGLPPVPGGTILEKRRYFRENLDHMRKALMWEPRGHADMYGAVITEPVTPDGDFGVIFLHNEGYSTMCGHGVIALTRFFTESGYVSRSGRKNLLNIDGPAGRIVSRAVVKAGKVIGVSFLNVPSFVLYHDEFVDVPGLGRVRFDLAFGGAFYAICEARDLDLDLDPRYFARLVDTGMKIREAVSGNFMIRHPSDDDLSFLYGTIFVAGPHDYRNHSRNVCIFANGELDRSATGSGVSARAALMHHRKELLPGKCIRIESILGTIMEVEIREATTFHGLGAVIPEVRGMAWFTGRNEFWIDPDDPLGNGFFVR